MQIMRHLKTLCTKRKLEAWAYILCYCEKIKEWQNNDDTRLVKLISTEGKVTELDERLNHVRSKSTTMRKSVISERTVKWSTLKYVVSTHLFQRLFFSFLFFFSIQTVCTYVEDGVTTALRSDMVYVISFLGQFYSTTPYSLTSNSFQNPIYLRNVSNEIW